jgi:predicted Zn-dependent protease
MRAPRIIPLVVAIVALLGGAGCGGGHREISDLQRKEAAHLASEADFAITLRDFPRAEGLLARVVELCPDTGPYWVSLGSVQLRLGQRSKAKASYQGALRALENAAKDNPDDPAAWLAQV